MGIINNLDINWINIQEEGIVTNFTNVTNNFEGVSTLKGLLGVANTNTGGFAWLGMLIMMQVIILMAMLPFGFFPAMISSAFIVLIAGMFLTYLDLVSWSWLMFFLGQILFAIIYTTWQER